MAARPQYLSGTTKVEEEQKPVPLATVANYPNIQACREIYISADPSNVGALAAVGDEKVNSKKTLGTFRGIPLEKTKPPVVIQGVDPTQLYIDVEKAKDAVTWVAVLP